jgi:hypothetical protein
MASGRRDGTPGWLRKVAARLRPAPPAPVPPPAPPEPRMDRYTWMQHHPLGTPVDELADGRGRPRDDDAELADRAIRAFRSTRPDEFYGPGSVWMDIFTARQREIVRVLASGPLAEARAILQNPHQNFLYYGFEDLYLDSYLRYRDPGQRIGFAMRCRDLLVRLAEALGALRVENPEGGPWGESMTRPLAELVGLVEARGGAPLPVPDLHPWYSGLGVAGGLITERAINAYYCAFRAVQLLGGRRPGRILEIGGGLGYVAYYATLMGVRDVTIVDVPLTSLCQAYFLLRALGADRVTLADEAPGPGRAVHLRPPPALAETGPVDLVINIDGLTEYGEPTAAAYLEAIARIAPRMLSVNHEANAYRLHDLVRGRPGVKSVQRFPYWLRNGYVEEIVEFA